MSVEVSEVVGKIVIQGNALSEMFGGDPKDYINPVLEAAGMDPYKHNPINMGSWAKSQQN